MQSKFLLKVHNYILIFTTKYKLIRKHVKHTFTMIFYNAPMVACR